MKVITRNRCNKCWFTFLLIIGIYASTTHSYGDLESLTNDDDTNISKKVTFESLIRSVNGKHRVRRVVDDTKLVTGIFPRDETSVSPITTAIYMITGYRSSTPTTYNGTYVITAFYPVTTTGTPLSNTTTTAITPATCNNGTHITLSNGTCVSRESLIQSALDILSNSSATDINKANAVSIYISAVTNSNLSNSSNIITIGQLDTIVGSLTNVNYNVSNNDSILLLTQPNPCGNVTTVIGASFVNKIGPTIIDTVNRDNVTDSFLSVAGVLNLTNRCYVNKFNMLIIKNPTVYQNIDNSTNSIVVSSIIIATINEQGYDPKNIVIDLYFQVLTPPVSTENGVYLCAFYDTYTSQWNESGCITLGYNTILNRYECTCFHLTSFALIWLPIPPSQDGGPPKLNAQDKASIAFQLLSIICFLGIIIHGITVRILNPQQYTQSRYLLPLISCGITMILFIFYIALGLTVFTRFAQSNTSIQTSTQKGRISGEDFIGRNLLTELVPRGDRPSTTLATPHIPCLPTEHVLMFIVYFLIIFMFCSKTSIGIDNYRRYVQLFPPPSPLMLIIMMITSFFISMIWLAFAVGFNSKPSNEITEIYLGKICWFNRSVIHYFLTIPICIFLVINLAMFIPVVKHNITHAQIKEEDRSNYNLRKQCIYILLASCVTQGFGWLFGPLMLIANPNAGEVLGWLFIIFNGLEGVWAILLYIVIEKEGINRNARDRDSKYGDRIFHEADVPQIQLDDIKDGDIDVPRTQLDETRDGIKTKPLASIRSDSPRNSFADFSETQTRHRVSQANKNDGLQDSAHPMDSMTFF